MQKAEESETPTDEFHWSTSKEMKPHLGVSLLCFYIGTESTIKRVTFLHFLKQRVKGSINTVTKLFLVLGQTFNCSLDKWLMVTFITTQESKWKTFRQSRKSRSEVSSELSRNICQICIKTMKSWTSRHRSTSAFAGTFVFFCQPLTQF